MELMPLLNYENKEAYHIYSYDSPNRPGFVGGSWSDGKITFSVSSLGTYTLLKDETAPTIQQRAANNGRLYFVIDDALSGVNDYKAEINGEWLLMHYDPKRKLIWSETLKKNEPLKGDFTLTVTDNAGNKKTLTLKI